ncbi:MAG: bacillithiol biosynthesis deacetylase BshB1 [Bacteroidota bacterium]
MKLDILAFAAHPDDVEMSCGATIAKYAAQGKKVGIVDFTMGQMGSRGTPEQRMVEAGNAKEILKLAVRENLGFEDIYFKNDIDHQVKVVEMIRKYQPEIVLANALVERHPDHERAAKIVKTAVFLSGLKKLDTELDGEKQEPWRPGRVYHYIQSTMLEPDFVEDVTGFWETRNEAIYAFETQVYRPNIPGPETFISSPEFLKMLDARGKMLGQSIGADYGEGFKVNRNLGVKDMFSLC